MSFLVVLCLPEAKGRLPSPVGHLASPHTFNPKFFKHLPLGIVLSRGCLCHAFWRERRGLLPKGSCHFLLYEYVQNSCSKEIPQVQFLQSLQAECEQ